MYYVWRRRVCLKDAGCGFQKGQAYSSDLLWTHYKVLLRTKSSHASVRLAMPINWPVSPGHDWKSMESPHHQIIREENFMFVVWCEYSHIPYISICQPTLVLNNHFFATIILRFVEGFLEQCQVLCKEEQDWLLEYRIVRLQDIENDQCLGN